MRILPPVTPSAEQLTILSDSRPGFRLIRGAAGSGKTTTALLRLKQLCASRLARQTRLGLTDPVQVLVLTYNRTLEGYISELARQQVAADRRLELEVTTFGKWARRLVGPVDILDRDRMTARLRATLIATTGEPRLVEFFVDEVEYALGRFTPEHLGEYLTRERTGRGISPRVDTALRRRLLDEVIKPYQDAKSADGVLDWNDLAQEAANIDPEGYDIVIVDEAQDFSANQVRAVIAHLAGDHSTTFILDAIQRIYPRFFTWVEVGIALRPNMIYSLRENHRNTAEIAAFARPLVEGLPVEDDGSLPDFSACSHSGVLPQVVAGTYSGQLSYMLDELARVADMGQESVAILQPKGGAWFNYARTMLRNRGITFCELTRTSQWPTGPEQVALSTIHSAKGLEFDHVLLPGLNQQVTPHGEGEGDATLDRLRRLLAMGVGRSRLSVVVGYKPGEESTLIGLLDPDTYKLVTV
ncbi:MAG TPA: 3'-5' exonuclease [Acidimicrobiales bacterium]|nr:3'-5' exonuclease [Acidimicrobiales bacterium]